MPARAESLATLNKRAIFFMTLKMEKRNMKTFNNKAIVALAACIVATTPAWAADAPRFTPVAQSFKAKLILTTTNIEQALATAGTPTFDTPEIIKRGQSATLAGFILGAGANTQGMHKVECDIVVTRPDGKAAFDQKSLPCLSGQARSPGVISLSNIAIRFVGDPGDPLGAWSAKLTAHDKVTGATAYSSTTFTLAP